MRKKSTFFLEYDATLQDYHIGQSRLNGAEQKDSKKYEFRDIFKEYLGQSKQKSTYTLGASNVKIVPTINQLPRFTNRQKTYLILLLMTKQEE